MQELLSWIIEDLAKSGLTRNDIEVTPFEPKKKKDGSLIHNGGYQIIYRSGDEEKMLSCNNQPFVRERYRPPPQDFSRSESKPFASAEKYFFNSFCIFYGKKQEIFRTSS